MVFFAATWYEQFSWWTILHSILQRSRAELWEREWELGARFPSPALVFQCRQKKRKKKKKDLPALPKHQHHPSPAPRN